MQELLEQAIVGRVDSMVGSYIDVNAGSIHREVGGYPGNGHRMPVCCAVMRRMMNGDDAIIASPPRGNGASLTVRYFKKNH